MVVVFGATSYLGQYVLDDLLMRGYRVLAVTRDPAVSEILLHAWIDRITVIAPDQLTAAGEAAAVVNLAYVKSETPHRLFRQNARLMRRVHDTAVRLGAARLVHVSTQAVFGYEIREPPRPVRVVGRPAGDAYVQSKMHAELLAEKLHSRAQYRLDIVRPGNIVGEGSPTWTANLAQRLREGRPVGLAGRDGYSNCAYAPNIASYLGHLVDAPASSAEIGRYHHFADLSELHWSAVISCFAEAVGVRPVLAAQVASRPRHPSVRPAIARALKSAYGGSIGSVVRRSLPHVVADGAMDAAIFATKTALAARVQVDPFETPLDRDLLTIMSSEHEFESHVLTDWTRPVGNDEALDRMAQWIVDAGFAVPQNPTPRATQTPIA